MVKVIARHRPFLVNTVEGFTHLMTTDDVQAILDHVRVERATAYRVVCEDGTRIVPATVGGGPAFEVQ